MGWQTQLRDMLMTLGGMEAGRARAQHAVPTQQALPRQPLTRLDRQPHAVQWIKVAKILSDGVSTAAHVCELQQSSGQLLDAAAYALDTLKAELEGTFFIESARQTSMPITAGSFRRAMPATATALAA